MMSSSLVLKDSPLSCVKQVDAKLSRVYVWQSEDVRITDAALCDNDTNRINVKVIMT